MGKIILTSKKGKLVKAKDFTRMIWDMRKGETIIINPHYLTHTSNEWLHYFQRPDYPSLELISKVKQPNGIILYVYRKVCGI